MKLLLVVSLIVFAGLVLSCDFRSGIAKEEMEKFSGTPTPSITPTPEQTPIPGSAIVQADTSLDGPVLTVNDVGQKTLNCTKYNLVSINVDASVVSIKGVCQKVTVNGDRNQVTAEAAIEFAFNGTGNSVTYSKFANGKQPIVTDNQASNTVDFAAAQEQKATGSSKKKK